VTIPIVIVGAVTTFTGIIVGNVAANQMWDETDQEADTERGMFSTGEVIGPGSLQGKRYDAVEKYRESHPDGDKLNKLRNGRVLTVVGIAVAFVGIII
jgi:hypothetical protein